MRSHFIIHLLLAGSVILAAHNLYAATEPDLIALLQSAASAPQKCEACLKLRFVGTAQSVPVLAALLGDERVSQAARNAIEALPGAEAGAALREALGRCSGLIKLGVIDSLGWRGELAAVPQLALLLSDVDATLAAGAAVALGRVGGPEAVAALSAARDQAPEAVKPKILDALLHCAEQLHANRNGPEAGQVYGSLLKPEYPPHVRMAAWRGLALADAGQRTALFTQALAGNDRPVQLAALKLIRALNDPQTVTACAQQWDSFPADSQLAVLDAHVKLGATALPTVRAARKSPHLAVRVAAWEALADLHDPSAIPALAQAAAHGDAAEQRAAREALTRVRGPRVRDALLAHLQTAEAPAKAELLRALGERGDTDATGELLKNAGDETEAVRLAALESLKTLAVQETITPLLDLAARSSSDEARQPVLKALYAVCQGSRDKADTSRRVVAAIGRFPTKERRQVLPLLAELGTAEALAAAQTATSDTDSELAKEAVRVLAQWPNAGPAPHLLKLARTGANPTIRALALRAGITVAGLEPDPTKRLSLLQQAMTMARQPNEKRQVLGQVGQLPLAAALDVALKELANPEIVNEAGLAAVSIAGKLAGENPQLADAVAAKVLAQCKAPEIVSRAWALRIKPKSGGPFIQDWQVCGPFSQAGAVGAEALFNVVFGPENSGEAVQWKSAPRGSSVNLAALFPGQANCVAYLRTRIIAPAAVTGALLMGSDDGIKAWLNGAVVHSNNTDRGEVPDQDMAPIQLQAGENELLLKITQGGGGWSACARVVGTDGQPIQGLRIQP